MSRAKVSLNQVYELFTGRANNTNTIVIGKILIFNNIKTWFKTLASYKRTVQESMFKFKLRPNRTSFS